MILLGKKGGEKMPRGRKPTKKQIQKFENNAVIIDGNMYSPTDSVVVDTHNELRRVEQGYVDKTISDFLEDLQEKKEKITNDILEYAQNEMKTTYNDEGEPTGRELKMASGSKMNEYVINRLFFSSLNPLTSKEPKYNAEKLALVFDMYEHIVSMVNQNICQLLPSKSHFCRFAGITTSTYNGYKLSEDPDMQVVMGKIEDMLADIHLTMAEEDKLNTNAMKYRLNIEMDKRENYNPQVVIKADVKDLEDYKNRINSLENIIESEVLDNE